MKFSSLKIIVYDLFYPAILGSMIYDLFSFERLVTADLLAYSVGFLVTLSYCADYVIVNQLADKDKLYNVLFAAFSVFLFKFSVVFFVLGNLEYSIVCIAIIPFFTFISLFLEARNFGRDLAYSLSGLTAIVFINIGVVVMVISGNYVIFGFMTGGPSVSLETFYFVTFLFNSFAYLLTAYYHEFPK